MRGLLSANLRAAKSSYVATALAIALAVAFLLTCLGLAGGMKAKMAHNLAHNVTGAEIVASIKPNSSVDVKEGQPGPLDLVAKDLSVAHREWEILTRSRFAAQISKQNHSNHSEVLGLAQPRFDSGELAKGTRPKADTEIGLDASIAKTLGVGIQDQVNVETYDPKTEQTVTQNFTVAGIYKALPGAFPTSYVTSARLQEWQGKNPISNLLLVASPNGELGGGASQAQALNEIRNLLAKHHATEAIDVATFNQYLSDQVDRMIGGNGLLVILLVFPLLAGVTAIIVVSVTYSVLLTRRRRTLALLRAVGATKGQLRRLFLQETLLVGAISSLLGIGIGTLATGVINHESDLTRTWGESFGVIDWPMLLACFLSGLIISVLAGYAPARQVSKVTPMQALAEEDPYAVVQKRRIVKTGCGAFLFLAGTAIMVWATMQSYHLMHPGETSDTFNNSAATMFFLLAMFSGALSFLGLLLLTAVVLPYLTAALGRLSPRNAMIWRLAAENTRRNPRRTGATGAALTLGVTLVVMMLTGAASMEATAQYTINTKKPLDFTLYSVDAPLTEDTIARAEQVKNIEKVTPVPALKGQVTLNKPSDKYYFPYEPNTTVLLAEDVAADDISRAPLTHPQPGQIVIPNLDKHLVGKTVTVTCGNKTLKFKTLSGNLSFVQLHPADLAKLRSADNLPYTQAFYAKIKDGITSAEVEQIASDLMALNPELRLESEAFMRVMFTEMLQAIMWGAVAMLGVSVVVSLVGVANTLGLSVLERRRENGLLRALGLTRSMMRLMLTFEAFLLGVGGGVIGLLAGIGYAVAGIYALPIGFEDDAPLVLVVPGLAWGAVAVVLVVAVLASVWPARSAAKVSPVEALAHD